MDEVKKLALTFDIGTQSARGVLIDPDGNIVAKEKVAFKKPYFSKNPGWAEQESDFYWENICNISVALKLKAESLWEDIVVVSITTIRDTNVCVDKEGKPLRPAILWLDKRKAEGKTVLDIKRKAIFKVAGMTETVNMIKQASPCNWIMENEKDIWEKTDKYLMLSGYMNFKFTGEMVDSKASIIGHVPFNHKKQEWMDEKGLTFPVMPVPKEKLSELVDPGTVIGRITKKASEETGIKEGIPFVATASDKGCETIGLSCVTPEKGAISFGTTATIQYTIDRYVEPQKFFPSYPAGVNGHYSPEIEIYRGYWLISWFKKEFAEKEEKEASKLGVSAEELLNKRLKEIKPGCDGLIFQPYFTPGVAMPNARGAAIGFSDIHTRIHIYRAIIEGINFALIDGMKTLEKQMGVNTESIYIAGGGSQSGEIAQITANMFGLPVYRTQTCEAAVIGSAALAYVGIGEYKDIFSAIDKMVHITSEFKPDMEEHKIYKKIYSDVFSKIFDKLKPLYDIESEMEDK
ncbi:MAG: FGGY-family carbohydrate kinase [Peptostreptococcaceae bacterium]|nr:FGGY-family carbohydrate kinase [Peptostreptococcaceae bacterium]